MAKKKQKPKKKTGRKSAPAHSSGFKFSLPLLAVLLITTLVFSGTLSNDFVNWDDDVNILENDNLNDFTAQNVGRIFHPEYGRVIGNYNPLPIFTFAVEKAIFGLNPTVFHFTNLLLHLCCVFLVWLLGRRLGLSVWAAAFLALLFGIHPMRVESVAWATERKDVLFGVFYFGAMLTWLRYLTDKGKKYFLATLGLFVLALFSKIQAVSLPLTLLVLDYWQKRDLRFKLLIEKIPFFALSLVFGLAGIYFLGEDGSLEDATKYTFLERLLVGAYSYCVYLVKAVVPYRMSPMYPYPASLSGAFYAAPAAVAVVAALFFYAFKKNWRVTAFSIAFFTVNVMFVLQILGAGQGYIADRFTYIPYFGLFFGAAWGVDYLLKNKPQMKTAVAAACAVLFLAYAATTYQQVKIWKNGLTLWTHVLKYYDYVTTPWVNLGHYHRDLKQRDKALQYYSKALDINGKKGEIYNSRGKLYFDSGQNDLALADFEKAVQFSPEVAEIHINRGAAYGMGGDFDKALENINAGLAIDPRHKNGLLNRSKIYMMRNQAAEAQADHKIILELDPNNADIWFEYGQTQNLLGDPAAGLQSMNRAVELNPNNKAFYRERAKVQQKLGNTAAAQQDMQRAQ